jgi:hypothetical protein
MNGNGNGGEPEAFEPEALLIMSQLGGQDFINMTEPSDIVWYKPSKKLLINLKSPFAKAKDGINGLIIQRFNADATDYNCLDDYWYNVDFLKINGLNAKVICTVEHVPEEGLPLVFTEYTGLDTHPGNN